mmetsp:Transcript_10216/g.25948  ORF Transcript_10216/g.25948 Transcript_10216/m.25948 type:complete len:386 (-) Transcript_10216:151-1308(-)
MSGLRAVFLACIFAAANGLLTQRRFQWEISLPEVPAAQRVTPAIFSYGRPTRQEVYRFKQAGFKSIVSVGPVARKTVPKWFELHGEYMSDDEYHALAKSIDMPLHVFVWGWDGLMKREAFDEFAAVMDSFPKPVLVHCGNGWLAALMGGLYAVRSGAYPPEEYYRRSADIGFEYQNETGLNLLYANLTNTQPRPSVPKKLHKRLNDMGYSKYYYTRRVNDDWYVMGQPNVTLEFDAMSKAGYGALVSLREDGEKNIDGSTFSVAEHKRAAEERKMKFFHSPLTYPITASKLQTVHSTLREAEGATKDGGPVLVQCKTAYRSVAAVVSYVGAKEKKSWPWAMRTAEAVGFSFPLLEGSDSTSMAIRQVLPGSSNILASSAAGAGFE